MLFLSGSHCEGTSGTVAQPWMIVKATPWDRLLPGVTGVPSAEKRVFRKSLLRNGCGLFIQMDQTQACHLPIPFSQSLALFWDPPKDLPSSIPESELP